ncbi:MAG: 3-hydroxyacyl-CoA dehydrogenase NAD-binding domain-containing protein [Bacteroidia bacterium]|nr:3-hydroxyacyl-CoA dehydrogenase NAD-binding domain-containing protein [Bacteroidia bacterium]MDW8348187.1 3-hydroxyacyl-CoA dehydrogenase NAD-binding domain-containing protein [Bacteroidia bacterium]
MDIKTIAIIGSGTMGTGIAQVAATQGYSTILFDINDTALKKAKLNIEIALENLAQKQKITTEQKDTALSRIRYTSEFSEIEGELIIEAIVENLSAKQELFSTLEERLPATTIFCSNTSSIPITQIASACKYPERVIGMHFFNPAPVMKLVEVIAGEASDKKLVEIVKKVAQNMQKVPILVKDYPGFIVNRVARHFYGESLKILSEQVAEMEQIDELLEATGFKMGAFKLMDLIGVDVNFAVTVSLFNAFYQDARFRPNLIQQKKVEAKFWGRKTGKGFYTYPDSK